MYSLAWLVVVGVVGLVVGTWIGHIVARVRSGAAARIAELEAQLESARDELSEYKGAVHQQFSETARKFKALDESYHDLHRQLAESAGILCGEAAGPMLAAPTADAIAAPLVTAAQSSAAATISDDDPEPAAGDAGADTADEGRSSGQ